MSKKTLWSILDELDEKREREQDKENRQEQYRSEWMMYIAEYKGGY